MTSEPFKNKLVHCYKCGGVILVVNEDREFKVDCKCPHCGSRQEITSSKTYSIKVKEKSRDN